MKLSSAIRPRRQTLWLMFLAASVLLLVTMFATPPRSYVSAAPAACTPGAVSLDFQVWSGPSPYDSAARGVGFRGKARHPYIEYTAPQLYNISAKVESVWVSAPNGDNVEIGWHKSIFYGGVVIGPQLLLAHTIGGVTTAAVNAPALQAEGWYTFRIWNDGTYWHWYLDSQEYVWAPYPYAMPTYGKAAGMGERDNTCTSGFARLINLEKYKNGQWSYWTGQIAPPMPTGCNSYCDGDPYYKYCYIYPTEFKVRAEGVDCFAP